MKGNRLLLLYALLLTLVGGGLAIWKVAARGYSLVPGKVANEWMVEGRVVFQAKEEPVKVSLALPLHLQDKVVASEAASVGYGFQHERGDDWKAVWTARMRTGKQRIFYRLRVPEEALTVHRFQIGNEGPEAKEPTYTGMTKEAASDLVARVTARSADVSSLMRQLALALITPEGDPEAGVLRRYYEEEAGALWLPKAVKELAGMSGVAAREVYAVRLERDLISHPPIRVVEYVQAGEWVVFDPARPDEIWPEDLAVWSRSDAGLLVVEGGVDSSLTFATAPVRVSKNRNALSGVEPALVSMFNALPLSERSVFRYVVLIPLGVLVVVVFRNLIGLETMGTFMPVLLALAFLEIPMLQALSLFAVVLAVALIFRFQLSRLHLLVVPRVAACVVMVALLMLLTSVLGYRVGFSTSLQLTIFPIIILAWTVERMSLLWEEEGATSALRQIIGSVIVAAAAFGVMESRYVQHLVFTFPELLLVVLALVMLLGRYTGYRLMELRRFREVDELIKSKGA